MKKKLISLLLAVTTLLSATCVSYADGDEGWTISYTDGDADKSDRTQFYAKITDDSTIEDGENLLLVDYGGTDKTDKNSYVDITAELSEGLVSGSVYTLSFSAKGFFTKAGATGFARRYAEMAEFKVGNGVTFTISDFAKTDIGNDWYSYSKDFTYTGSGSYVKIRVYGALGGNNKSAFDNISLATQSGIELVKNPEFKLVESAPEEYYASDFYSYPDAGIAYIGWTNPKARGLKKISLYERIGEERVLLKDDFPLISEGEVDYSFGSFDEGTTLKTRLFEVEFDFRGKKPYVYYLSLAPTDVTSVKESLGFDFKVGKNLSGLMTPARYAYRRDDKNPHGGNGYMRMSLTEGTGSLDISNVISLPLKEALVVGENYKVSLYYRAEGSGFASHLTLGVVPDFGAVGDIDGYQGIWNQYTNVGNVNQWNLYQKDITATVAATNLFFIHYHNNLDIDDVSICKVMEDGSLGENLVMYGDCEGTGKETGKLNNAELIDIGTNNMTLVYSPEANISYIDMYRKDDGVYRYCGKISPRQKEIYIDGLDLGTEHFYKLVPYNYDGVEGEAVEVSGTTLIPDYTITGQTLLKNGSSVSLVAGMGSYAVQTVVTNYKVENMKYAQVVAVYKDNTLQKLYIDNHSFTPGYQDANENVITTNIEIGGGTGWTVELYMWDSSEDMNILAPSIIFGER